MASWATKEDLYARYGQEYVAKIAARRNWDAETGQWIASDGPIDVGTIVNIALDDAKTLITQRLSCLFSNFSQVNQKDFYALKLWHIKVTIELLKVGGDCSSCDCKGMDDYFKCNSLCSDDGFCLSKKTTFISASVAEFKCECFGGCRCC